MKIAPLTMLVPEYTQVEENSLVAGFSGQPLSVGIIYNTDTLTLRRWNGTAFENISITTGTTGADLILTDITTNNFTTAKHGFVPKGTNVGNFLKDDGTWTAIAGGGDMVLASLQTVTGAKTFNDTKLLLQNVASFACATA